MGKLLTTTGLVCAALCIAAAGQAQVIGVKAGYVYSDASVKVDGTSEDTGARNGFTIGALYDQNKLIGLRIEGLYTEKGFDGTSRFGGFTTKLAYIEVPVMLSAGIPLIRGYAGPNFAFEVNCTGSAVVDGNSLCDGGTNAFDLGLKVGATLKVLIAVFDLNYTHGLSDVSKIDNVEIKNRTASVGIGVSF